MSPTQSIDVERSFGEETVFVELIEPLESCSIDSTLRTTLSYPVVRPFNVLLELERLEGCYVTVTCV